jgi:hypothetical protein
MGGDTNQWQPANLARNTTCIYPFQGNPSHNLTTAMADEAIAYIDQVNTLTPDQPFFVHYVPGGCARAASPDAGRSSGSAMTTAARPDTAPTLSLVRNAA